MLVGLATETGEIGVRGIAPGDFNDKDGRGEFCAAEMLSDSLGLAAERAALYMIARMSAQRFGVEECER